MCAIAPHFPIIINNPYEPAYFIHFGWGINGLGSLYFVQWGGVPVFINP